MTPGHAHQPPRTAVLHMSLANIRTDLWCAVCKAHSAFTADVVTLTPAGVTVVGSITGCVICDDPEVNGG